MTREQSLRRIRQKIFDYPDYKEQKARRVLLYLKSRILRQMNARVPETGIYSGLTKSELHKTGTTETDWF